MADLKNLLQTLEDSGASEAKLFIDLVESLKGGKLELVRASVKELVRWGDWFLRETAPASEESRFGFRIGEFAEIVRPSRSLKLWSDQRRPKAEIVGFTGTRVRIIVQDSTSQTVRATVDPKSLRASGR